MSGYERKPSLMKKVLGKKIICEMLGVSPTTLWRMVKRGDFPAPIQISPGRVGWVEEKAEAYIDSRPQGVVKPSENLKYGWQASVRKRLEQKQIKSQIKKEPTACAVGTGNQ